MHISVVNTSLICTFLLQSKYVGAFKTQLCSHTLRHPHQLLINIWVFDTIILDLTCIKTKTPDWLFNRLKNKNYQNTGQGTTKTRSKDTRNTPMPPRAYNSFHFHVINYTCNETWKMFSSLYFLLSVGPFPSPTWVRAFGVQKGR